MNKESENKFEDSDTEIIEELENIESEIKTGDFIPGCDNKQSDTTPESSGIGEMCAVMIEILCGKIADAYNEDSLALSKEEKSALSGSIEEVARYYDIDTHPLIGLAMVTAGLSLPRYMAIKSIEKEKIKKQNKKENGKES